MRPYLTIQPVTLPDGTVVLPGDEVHVRWSDGDVDRGARLYGTMNTGGVLAPVVTLDSGEDVVVLPGDATIEPSVDGS